jgi:hypothetical protein
MKPIKTMTQAELAAYVQDHLHKKGIEVVLSGGTAVAIYCSNKYVSKDIDLVNVHFVERRRLKIAMEEIGFREVGRYFEYPDTDFQVEFPPGPLSVGDEPIGRIEEIKYKTGTLRVISPTDCIKDRLVAYYHWGDQQCLAQALLVAQDKEIDIDEIERWSKVEGMGRKFRQFRDRFVKSKKA